DATLYAAERARGQGSPRSAERAGDVLDRLGVTPGRYLLATVHRASNTDNAANLASIVSALSASGEPVVFPVHPRTRKAMEATGVRPGGNVLAVEPVSYLE